MGLIDRLSAFLRRESADLRDVLDDTEARLDADLTRREAALDASPEERLAATLEAIEDNDAELDALRDRFDGTD